MLTENFELKFQDLTGAFVDHADVSRSPETLAELGRARMRLEDARRAIFLERHAMMKTGRSRPAV